MAEYTRIIELYGFPGCGKTTLKDALINESQGSKNLIGSLSELSSTFISTSFLSKIRKMPVIIWFRMLFFIISHPMLKLPVKHWTIYRSFFYLAWVYQFKKDKSVNSNYIVVDHGIVQSMMSLLFDHNNPFSEARKKYGKKILDKLNIDLIVYCNVDMQVAIQRTQQRGRHGKSRFDNISSSIVQEQLFDKYSKCLEFINNSVLEGCTKPCVVDMKDDVNNIVVNLSKLVSIHSIQY